MWTTKAQFAEFRSCSAALCRLQSYILIVSFSSTGFPRFFSAILQPISFKMGSAKYRKQPKTANQNTKLLSLTSQTKLTENTEKTNNNRNVFGCFWCLAIPFKMATCDECCGFNLKDVESYVKKHDIHYILKDCIIKLCSSRPDNPYRFMREYFETLEKVCVCCLHFSFLFDAYFLKA